jgi:5-formyltetrahydrofolate cyclo-ligase
MNLQKKSKPLDEKRLWRESLKAALQQHSEQRPPAELRVLQDQLVSHLCKFLSTQSGVWAGYRALPQEPDLAKVYEQTKHLTWAFPRIEDADLHFHTCETFVKGPFGILEPAKESPVVQCHGLQGVLIPGLGFDKKGRRLGRGRGFYDRALAGFQGFKVGVCFECQVIEDDLPDEAHDVPMDALVTETEIIIIKAS